MKSIIITIFCIFVLTTIIASTVAKARLEDNEQTTRTFDTDERSWFARYLKKRNDNHHRYSSQQSTSSLPPPLIPGDEGEVLFSSASGCQEIRSLEDIRVFLSTHKQAWLVLYTPNSKLTSDIKQLESFRKQWARFSSIVTFGRTGAVVGAINVDAYPHIIKRFPTLDGLEMLSEEEQNAAAELLLKKKKENKDKNNNLKQKATKILLASSSPEEEEEESEFDQERLELFNSLLKIQKQQVAKSPFRVRYWGMGPKFIKEEVVTIGDEEITSQMEIRNGAADTRDTFPRRAHMLSDPFSYDYETLVEFARSDKFFVSRAVSLLSSSSSSEIDDSLESLENDIILKKSPKLKKSIVLLRSSSSSSPSSNDDDDDDAVVPSYYYEEGADFMMHFISRQWRSKDLVDQYMKPDPGRGVFDSKMAFVIIDRESNIGKSLLLSLNKKPEKDIIDLIYYNFDENQNKFIASRYRDTSLELEHIDFRNIARTLSTQVAPPISPNAIPAVECSTLEECFTKHPKVPFVVRNPREVFDDPENNFDFIVNKLRKVKSETEFVEGVAQLTGDAEFLQISEAIERFLNNTLTMNVLDGGGVINFWNIPEMVKKWKTEGILQEENSDIVILSPRNSFTAHHFDPPNQGSTMNLLFTGSKRYEMIHPKYSKLLECELKGETSGSEGENENENKNGDDSDNDEESSRFKPNDEADNTGCSKTPQQVKEESGIDVEIIYANCSVGCFVVFPPKWIHAVWTGEPTMTANGYLDFDKKF